MVNCANMSLKRLTLCLRRRKSRSYDLWRKVLITRLSPTIVVFACVQCSPKWISLSPWIARPLGL
jgi:hypothetical protein